MTRGQDARRPGSAGWRGTAAGLLVAAATLVAAAMVTDVVGLPLRDPDHVAAIYLAVVGCGVAAMVGLDILLRARARSGAFPRREPCCGASGASGGHRGARWPSEPR